MFKNKLGEDLPIPKFMHLKIRLPDGIESLTTLEEGEFKVPIDGCIKGGVFYKSTWFNLLVLENAGVLTYREGRGTSEKERKKERKWKGKKRKERGKKE